MSNPIDRYHRGSNQSGMRAHNERLVLSLLRRHNALAKAEIAQMTGLSAQTVSVIMRELEKEGLIMRGARKRVQGKVGQPSVPLSLNPSGAYFFGLKIGRRTSDLVLIDFLGNEIECIHHTYPYPTPESLIQFALSSIEEISSKLTDEQKSRVAGLGIGSPFALWEWVEKVGAPQAIMDAWRTADIRAQIEAEFDFPVYLENDATVACGAELVFGRTDNLRDILYFYLGSFVGGGIILNGSLHTGRTGNAGALGSMPIAREDGSLCQLIDLASLSNLEEAIKSKGGDVSSLWLSTADWQIDQVLLDAWIESASYGIAHAIASSVSVFEFEAAIIDGWLPEDVRAVLVEKVIKHLEPIKLSGLTAPLIQAGTVGNNARAIGAASLPLSNRFMVDQNAFLKD